MPSTVTELQTRESVMSNIARASLFGHMGLFIGTGFSMALAGAAAPSFKKLLETIATELRIPLDFNNADDVRGHSFPQLATKMLDALESRYGNRPKQLLALKQAASRICDLKPIPTLLSPYSSILHELQPSWIITTNYDLIIETLIPSAISVLPDQAVTPRRDRVPVYHMHGHRSVPSSIVLTEEDYIGALGPMEYRQIKLSLLLTESTTIMLGYSLGDINVRLAMNHARSFADVHGLQTQPYQGTVVQALYVTGKTPEPKPYIGNSGEIIIETTDIYGFLAEVRGYNKLWEDSFNAHKIFFDNTLPNLASADQLLADPNLRRSFSQALGRFPQSYTTHSMIEFLRRVLDGAWQTARQVGNWEFYAIFLGFLLDIIESIDPREFSPILFDYISENLDKVAGMIQPDGQKEKGKAWTATEIWNHRRSAIKPALIAKLREYANDSTRLHLKALLDRMPNP